MRSRCFRPLRVVPQPSRQGLLLTLVTALAATAALCATGGEVLALLVCVPFLAWWQARQFGALGAVPPVLEVNAAGELLHDGQPARLAASSLVLPWLMVLRGRTARGRFVVVLCADSAPAGTLRALRVFLHWHVSPRLALRPTDLESPETSP